MEQVFEIKLCGEENGIGIEYVEENFLPTENTGIQIYDQYKISIMLTDGLLVVLDNIATRTEKGDFLVFRPDEIHFGKILDTHIHKFLNIFIPINYFKNFSVDTKKITKFLEHRNQPNPIRQNPKNREKLLDATKPIIDAINKGDFNTINLFSYILNILLLLADFYNNSEESPIESDIPLCVAKTLNYISQNFSGKITLKELADNSYCSVAYLSKMFKQHMGCTVYEQLTNYRILNAKKLLRDGKTITEVSYECGFGDCSHFIKTFKHHTGITPYYYKKNYKSIQ